MTGKNRNMDPSVSFFATRKTDDIFIGFLK